MLNVNNKNNINKMSSVSDLSITTSIMQQLKSSSQTSQSSSSSISLTSSLVSNSNLKSKKLESDQILSSSSNYNIIGGVVALAEAELDELDDDVDEDGSMYCATLANINDEIELMDNEQNSKQIANSTKSLTGGASDLMSNKVNNIKMNLMNSSSSLNSNATNNNTTTNNNAVVLSPEEKVSNEAKEYWATIDLYNNSKLAFNKRLKSVKIKREKINAEINHRNQIKQDAINLSNNAYIKNSNHSTSTTEPCMCVKCSIVYHESVIKGILPTTNETKTILCNKCCKNSINCKCCNSSSSISSNATMSNNNFSEVLSLTSTSSLTNNSECSETKKIPFIKEELNQFEDKLFNIKNELVNLSETSLDVFQLLLQLSDTMLDINTQLNSNSSSNLLQTNLNSNNLFSLNSFLGSDTNNFLYEEEEDENYVNNENEETLNEDKKNSTTSQNHKSNVIEDFLHKTLNPSNSFRNNSNNNNCNNSISNIIKTYNNNNDNRIGSFSSTPSQSFRSSLTKQNTQSFNKPLQLKKLQSQYSDSASSSPSSVANLIENIYEKTSVTQFVDSLLNSNKTQSVNSINELSTESKMSDCFSTLSSTNNDLINEPVYQSIDSEYLKISKNTTSTVTLTNLIGQPLNYVKNLKKANSTRETFTTMKSSKSNCSSTSSTSSSSGCGGSSSICSSSNNDLTFMAENNNRNSTSSTTSSVLVSPTTSCLSTLSSNNENLNKKISLENKNYEMIVSTSSSNASSPQNSIACSSSFYSNLPANQYKRSNSVNYKTINNTNNNNNNNNNNTAIIANRKPSFKFESNILNKVQFMNMNKTEKNESTSHLQDNLKSIKRQQSLSINKSFSHNQHQSGASLSNNQINKTALIKTPTKSSIIINQIKMNQISLDSGIFLPSETEEYNSFNLIR